MVGGMLVVGTLEAKTHFSSLLAQVERGQEVTITRHGRPIARLLPAGRASHQQIEGAVAGLKAFRRGRRLGAGTVKDLIDDGRP
jgi:prevent-host-death family protein